MPHVFYGHGAHRPTVAELPMLGSLFTDENLSQYASVCQHKPMQKDLCKRSKPGPKPPIVDPQRRRGYVEKLLKKISERHGGKRPDMIIAAFADVSVYAVRQWLSRGVARHHRQLVANLADVDLQELERAHGEKTL
jgi:hypothetical protein